MSFHRETPLSRSVEARVHDYKEIYEPFAEKKTVEQATRCMDCGVPFCHHGCPLGNNIPDFNDAVFREDWEYAIEILSSTNNFPEFTGRICPAPCEGSCVLGINKPPVAIEHIEKTIAEKAFDIGYFKANPPQVRTGKKVAVVGSGPAGLAAAAQLNQAGHTVTVFERDQHPGGLLRYGIPDFKLEKWVVERRVKLMEDEGVVFKTNTNVGVDIDVNTLKEEYDAILLCGGATIPRDLPIPGRELDGVHFAMDFLTNQNRLVSNESLTRDHISAKDKHVVVIGGGDTGSDCVGTSNRHGAKSITQIELLSKPPEGRAEENPWPEWPMILRSSSSHDEGCDREWAIMTEAFIGDENGKLKALRTVEIEWKKGEDGRFSFEKIAGSEQEIPCELALLAIGFVHPQWEGLLDQLELEADARKNVLADTKSYQTSVEHVFAAGDMRRGQSLVVWAIAEGREAASAVNKHLEGEIVLEKINVSKVSL